MYTGPMQKRIYQLVFIAIVMCSCSKSQDTQPTNNAKACFTVVASASQATPVQFTSDCSLNAFTYSWDFGDGGISSDANPTHTYSKSGTFTVALTLTAANKTTNTFQSNIKIISTPVKYHSGDITAD